MDHTVAFVKPMLVLSRLLCFVLGPECNLWRMPYIASYQIPWFTIITAFLLYGKKGGEVARGLLFLIFSSFSQSFKIAYDRIAFIFLHT